MLGLRYPSLRSEDGPATLDEGMPTGADTVTFTRKLTAFNNPDTILLRIVAVANDFGCQPHYRRHLLRRERHLGAPSLRYDRTHLVRRTGPPT